MELKAFWEDEFTLTSYDVDFTGRLSVYSLLRRFQELAGSHAAHLGVGYDELRRDGLAWFLSRIKIEVESLPRWGETVRLVTWPKGIDRLFALREFRMEDGAGKSLLVATSSWLLVDTVKGRPRRLETILGDRTFVNTAYAIREPLEKLQSQPSLACAYEKDVLPSDLDVNLHVNNAEYAKWVLDCYDAEMQKLRMLRSIQLNYLEETLLRDRVRIMVSPEDPGAFVHYVEGIRVRNGSTLFQALVHWKE
ncbi:MAG: acyl-ACP thioesterase domain-containing protein [Bacteroidota bacterium]